MLHVTSAKYIDDYRIWVCFDDGTEGEADLSSALSGPAFAPLRDKTVFGRFSVDPELETIVWPNGADLAPEYLKELVANSLASTRGIA
ncbi:MAG: DUF2442 domain-containing protein [Spongiibacteraceae bacterium]